MESRYKDQTERKIALIRSKLIEEYNNQRAFSQEMVTLSQELDLLILKHYNKYPQGEEVEPVE